MGTVSIRRWVRFRPASKLTEGCEQYGLGSAPPPPLLYPWLTHCTMAPALDGPMLGELGTSVLNPERPNIFFHLIFDSKLDKNNILAIFVTGSEKTTLITQKRKIIGERERANLIVQRARIFCYIYISITGDAIPQTVYAFPN